jgi:hypothetical protein
MINHSPAQSTVITDTAPSRAAAVALFAEPGGRKPGVAYPAPEGSNPSSALHFLIKTFAPARAGLFLAISMGRR